MQDGLRAVAVLAVLLNHAHPHWLPGGFLGVDTFFVLAGYVVARSWRPRGAAAFYRRRLRRLQPALVVCVALSAAIAAPIALLSQNLDYFGPAAAQPVHPHMELGVEDQFYLLLPLLIRRPGLLLWLTPASLVLWMAQQSHQPEAACSTPACCSGC